jgi:predicted CXXCH cytochrome family protein
MRLETLLVLSAIWASRISIFAADDTVEHPFIDKRDIKSETCLTCHPDKKDGRFVHPAAAMGCQNCHLAASRDEKTTITLIATGGDLCARCHEAKKASVVHGPYQAGLCLVCHDPHTGNFPRQTRAQANTLCLGCHGAGERDVKVNAENQLVTLPGGQAVSLAEYRQAPKITLDASGVSGHPVAGHPVSARDPRTGNSALSCLSCHDPHSSALPDLMPVGVKSAADLCRQCHQ